MDCFDNFVKKGGGFAALSDGRVPEPTPTPPHIDPIPPSAQNPVALSSSSSSAAAASSLVNARMTNECASSEYPLQPPIPLTPSVPKQALSVLQGKIQKSQEQLQALLNQREKEQKALQDPINNNNNNNNNRLKCCCDSSCFVST